MSIGPTEIIIVLVLALLVLGPSRLPQMGRTLGRGVREFKQAAQTAKDELGISEVIDDVSAVKNDVMASVGVDELKASLGDVTSTIDDAKASTGLSEITAGVGSLKTAMAFDPKRAAKDLVTGKRSAGTPAVVPAEGKAEAVEAEIETENDVQAEAVVRAEAVVETEVDAVVEAEADAEAEDDADVAGPFADLVTPPIPVAQA